MAGDFIRRSRHGTVFYFRRRVPFGLRARLGRMHFYASLHTEELAEAKRRARLLAAATDRLFTELRYMDDANSIDDRIYYGLTFDIDPKTRTPRITATDVKPGEEASVSELSRLLMGLAEPPTRPPAPSSTPTVADAIAAVLGDPGLKPSTVKEYRRAFDYFAAYFGTEARLGDITQERFAEFADHVRDSMDRQPRTQAFYITSAQRLFTFYASRISGVPQIKTDGLKPRRKGPASADREAFTLGELETLFRHAAKYRLSEPAKWWATVVPAFMGLRVEELAQAHLDGDFAIDSEHGIAYLQIDETSRGSADPALWPKSVKSQAGWRKVPIHPVLVEAGFIEYLDAERRAGMVTPFAQMWPPLRGSDGRVKHSHPISKWGGNELASLRASGLIVRQRLSFFHSMRHAFVTFLAKADVSEEWRAAITGHQYGGINAQIYNKAKQDVATTLPKIQQGLAPLVTVFAKVAKGLR